MIPSALCAILLSLPAGESKHLVRDLDRVRAHWLAVAPPEFIDALEPLGDLRAKTMTVAFVRSDDVAARFGPGAKGIRALVERAKPRFLVLAGDADRLPPFIHPSAYTSNRFASEPDLATDHDFGAVTGRLPADSAAELGVMVAKIVSFETTLPGGAWQKRISFLGGEAGFNPIVDQIIEKQFSQVVSGELPPAYDVEVAFAKPSSKYCYYPPKFHENALRLLNDGALFFVYVGHGFRTSFDSVGYNDRSYPIFDRKHGAQVEIREGLPVMIVIACSTGEFDAEAEDCIGETLFKRPRGPVAFIGGSRVTQPYANALLSRALVDQIFRAKAPTVGEALWAAKAAVLEKDVSPLRLQADALAGAIQGPANLELMRKDVILHYNLLGDPASPLRRPGDGLQLQARGLPGPGRTFTVTGSAPDGPVELSFEVPRDRFARPVDLEGATPEEAIGRRYLNANTKWIVRMGAVAKSGAFEAELELPETLKSGRHWLKAWASGSAAALEVVIPE